MKISKKANLITGESTNPNPLDLIALGLRGNSYRQDLSDYVIHFTKGTKEEDPYWTMLSILYQGRIKRGDTSFGISKDIEELHDKNRTVCFSETPLGYLQQLVDRRSCYGIGFRKELIASRGGNPIWYVDSNSPQAAALRKLKTQGKPRLDHDRRFRGLDESNPIWEICPFIEFTFSFGGLQHRFEWEREWRVKDDFLFSPEDIEFLLIPAELHAKARRFFEDAQAENTGPAYLCPYIDPRWNLDRFLPLNLRLEQQIAEIVDTLSEFRQWSDTNEPLNSSVIENAISAIRSLKLPEQLVPEKVGQGRIEKTLLNETLEM